MHRLLGPHLYPHFDVGCALTHHDQHVSSSPLRLQSPKPTLRRGCKGYATLILYRILAAYGTVNLRTNIMDFRGFYSSMILILRGPLCQRHLGSTRIVWVALLVKRYLYNTAASHLLYVCSSSCQGAA